MGADSIHQTKVIKMWQLNLPEYKFRIKIHNNKQLIFDSIRKKFVALTPEEYVRQHFIQFLIEQKNYPQSRLAIEKEININGLKKRCDAVVYNTEYTPIMIIEFKAPHIKLSQQTFDQAAIYNSKLNVNYLIISNGIEHFACWVDKVEQKYNFMADIPDYNSLI